MADGSRLHVPSRRSIRRRVVAGLSLIIAALSGLTIYSIVLYRRTVAEIALISDSYLPLALGTADIRATQLVFSTLMDRLADDRQRSVTRDWIDAARRYRPVALKRLADDVSVQRARGVPAAEKAFLAGIERRLRDVHRQYVENERAFQDLYTLMDTGRTDEAAARIETLKRTERKLDRVLSRIGEDARRRVTRLAEGAQRDGVRATWGLAVLTVAALLVGTAIVLSTNRLLSPLRDLQAAVSRVARGDIRTRIRLDRRDEIGALADAFNHMTDALAERDEMLIRSERLATAGKMTAQLTHEIRNPLSSLRLNADLLEEEIGPTPERSEARALLLAMRDEIERLTSITESYLRFAKPPTAVPIPSDLNAAVDSVIDFMRVELDERGVVVERDMNPHLEPIPLDLSQIRQALINLIRNACEAMPSGGRIRISTRDAGPMVELAVSDTGCGVPPEALDHIFDSFFSTKNGGTGLGLPLVRQICLAHGGDVRCEDSGPGGSTFVMSLPRSPANDSAMREDA